MLITNRHSWWFGSAFILGSLIIHDRNLYPELSLFLSLLLSCLRFFLIAAPLVFGIYFIRNKNNWIKKIYFLAWLFFLPYTIYSAVEIRHVSELCRLTGNNVYTQVCVADLWKLLPVFIYSLTGTMVFTFSLSAVSAYIFPISSQKRLFILGICFYTAAATVFGLITRFNMWAIFLHPITFSHQALSIASTSNFWYNTLALTAFFSGLVFILNRIFKNSAKFLK